MHRYAGTAAASERKLAASLRALVLRLVFGTSRGETQADPGDGQNHAAVRRLDRITQNRVDIDHFLDTLHRGLH